jgi:hypothetical protein
MSLFLPDFLSTPSNMSLCVLSCRKSVLELQRSVFLFAKVLHLNLNKYILPWYNFPFESKSHIQRNKIKISSYVRHNKTSVSIVLAECHAILNRVVIAQIDFSGNGKLNQTHTISYLFLLSARFEENKIILFNTIQ